MASSMGGGGLGYNGRLGVSMFGNLTVGSINKKQDKIFLVFLGHLLVIELIKILTLKAIKF